MPGRIVASKTVDSVQMIANAVLQLDSNLQVVNGEYRGIQGESGKLHDRASEANCIIFYMPRELLMGNMTFTDAGLIIKNHEKKERTKTRFNLQQE